MTGIEHFVAGVSESASTKFFLAWSAFLLLALPTAVSISLGVPEQFAVAFMLVALLPFLYIAFRVLDFFKEPASTPGSAEFWTALEERRVEAGCLTVSRGDSESPARTAYSMRMCPCILGACCGQMYSKTPSSGAVNSIAISAFHGM